MSSRVRRERVVDPFTRGEAAHPALAASDVGTRVRFVFPRKTPVPWSAT